jgi:hypothetical protein
MDERHHLNFYLRGNSLVTMGAYILDGGFMRALPLFLFTMSLMIAGCGTIPGGGPNDRGRNADAGSSTRQAAEPADLEGLARSQRVARDATMNILNCESRTIDYIALPALPVDTYNALWKNPKTDKMESVAYEWPDNPVEVNKLLTNISANTSIGNSSLSGSLGLFSAAYSRKQYVIDFMKWRGELLTTTNNLEVGWVRLGAGLRLNIEIETTDAGATGSLLALAASAKAGKTSGTISAELIGMDAPEITLSVPFSVDLSEGNVLRIIETMAVVKAKLYDKNTTLKPNLIARMACAPAPSAKS